MDVLQGPKYTSDLVARFLTAQKIKFYIKDFFSKCDQICSFLLNGKLHFLYSVCLFTFLSHLFNFLYRFFPSPSLTYLIFSFITSFSWIFCFVFWFLILLLYYWYFCIFISAKLIISFAIDKFTCIWFSCPAWGTTVKIWHIWFFCVVHTLFLRSLKNIFIYFHIN